MDLRREAPGGGCCSRFSQGSISFKGERLRVLQKWRDWLSWAGSGRGEWFQMPAPHSPLLDTLLSNFPPLLKQSLMEIFEEEEKKVAWKVNRTVPHITGHCLDRRKCCRETLWFACEQCSVPVKNEGQQCFSFRWPSLLLLEWESIGLFY